MAAQNKCLPLDSSYIMVLVLVLVLGKRAAAHQRGLSGHGRAKPALIPLMLPP